MKDVKTEIYKRRKSGKNFVRRDSVMRSSLLWNVLLTVFAVLFVRYTKIPLKSIASRNWMINRFLRYQYEKQ